jgi:hypothetical protein
LAVLPNLPALREAGFVAMFEFGPFEGWQRAFSTKSALSWFDRGGMLGAGMDPGFAPTTLNGGTYLGLVCGAVLAVALWRGFLQGREAGGRARLLLALAMGAFWLSFGPHSVLGGHFEFLKMSMGAADFTPAVAWFLLGAQVWVIFQLVPRESVAWRWAAVGLSLVYLLVPGFRLLEFLPIYRNIRAPFDFYQVTGSICLIGAVALAAGALLEKVRWGFVRRGRVEGLFGGAGISKNRPRAWAGLCVFGALFLSHDTLAFGAPAGGGGLQQLPPTAWCGDFAGVCIFEQRAYGVLLPRGGCCLSTGR